MEDPKEKPEDGKEDPSPATEDRLKEGVDFYFNEEGLMVLTREFLLKRGFCCHSGCLHCPY